MRTAKTLIRLGGCPGWSESSLGAVILLVLSCRGSYLVCVSLLTKDHTFRTYWQVTSFVDFHVCIEPDSNHFHVVWQAFHWLKQCLLHQQCVLFLKNCFQERWLYLLHVLDVVFFSLCRWAFQVVPGLLTQFLWCCCLKWWSWAE